MDRDSVSSTSNDFHQQWWVGRTDDSKSIGDEHDDPFSNKSVQRMKEM